MEQIKMIMNKIALKKKVIGIVGAAITGMTGLIVLTIKVIVPKAKGFFSKNKTEKSEDDAK